MIRKRLHLIGAYHSKQYNVTSCIIQLGGIWEAIYISRYKNMGREEGASREEVPESSFRHLTNFSKTTVSLRIHDATLVYQGLQKLCESAGWFSYLLTKIWVLWVMGIQWYSVIAGFTDGWISGRRRGEDRDLKFCYMSQAKIEIFM